MTINKVCGSGLKAVALRRSRAAWRIRNRRGRRHGVHVQLPYLLPQARTGYRIGNGKLVDSMINDGLWDAYENFHMA